MFLFSAVQNRCEKKIPENRRALKRFPYFFFYDFFEYSFIIKRLLSLFESDLKLQNRFWSEILRWKMEEEATLYRERDKIAH